MGVGAAGDRGELIAVNRGKTSSATKEEGKGWRRKDG